MGVFCITLQKEGGVEGRGRAELWCGGFDFGVAYCLRHASHHKLHHDKDEFGHTFMANPCECHSNVGTLLLGQQ